MQHLSQRSSWIEREDPELINTDTTHAGAELIERKCLRKRITIVPLNKTRVNIVSQQKQGRAAAHTHGRATLALELASFDKDVTVAMQYAFGNVFICEDRNAARKVMESSDVACRAISLQGDDYSPAGTLTGGSRGNGEQLLTRLAAFADAEAELHQHEVCRLSACCRIHFGDANGCSCPVHVVFAA